MGQASTYYNKNNSDNSYGIMCLGIAYHYFSDLNVPYHAGNVIQNANDLSPHTDWEDYTDYYKTEAVATSASLWYNYHGPTFNDYALASGNNAVSNLWMVTDYSIGSVTSWSAAKTSLLWSQQNGAAMIDAFFRSEDVF